jgi:hypothetical protein
MVTAHALTLAAIPDQHWMQALRPRAWATTGFVMLTGYTLALIQLRRPTLTPGFAGLLWKRAMKLAIVAYVSNAASETIISATSGGFDAAHLLDALLLRTPWTISGILVPTTIVVALAPALVLLARRLNPVAMLAVAVAANIILEADVTVPFTNVTLRAAAAARGPFSFPVFDFVAGSCGAFALGAVVARVRPAFSPWTVPVAVASAVLVLAAVPLSAPGPFAVKTVRFVITLGLAGIMVAIPVLGPLRAGLQVLGRAALLAFVAHRPALHLARLALGGLLSREALALALMASVMTLCIGLAVAKQRSARVAGLLAHAAM